MHYFIAHFTLYYVGLVKNFCSFVPYLRLVREGIKCQGLFPVVDEIDSFIERLDGQNGENGAKNLLLH